MDEKKLAKTNIRKALIEAYDRVVALHPDCEEGFKSLVSDNIRVFVSDQQVKVIFPCLHMHSVSALCAQQAIRLVSRQLFCEPKYYGTDVMGVISGKKRGPESLETTHGHFLWVHQFNSAKQGGTMK